MLRGKSQVTIAVEQSTEVIEQTAAGYLLLSENSLITGAPSTVVPYLGI
jgi:hypothetical protein